MQLLYLKRVRVCLRVPATRRENPCRIQKDEAARYPSPSGPVDVPIDVGGKNSLPSLTGQQFTCPESGKGWPAGCILRATGRVDPGGRIGRNRACKGCSLSGRLRASALAVCRLLVFFLSSVESGRVVHRASARGCGWSVRAARASTAWSTHAAN